MKHMQRILITACGLALSGAAWTPAFAADATASYLKGATPRFQSFAGSSENLSSLAYGMRTGSKITLTQGNEVAMFTSPTRPMGYGNITRSLDLAQRQLALQGISNPTPSQLQAALTGGTIIGPKGTVNYAGVLKMRSDGMGWGQIAHSVGVHPGLGKTAAAPAASHARVTSAGGHNVTTQGSTRSASVRASGNGNAKIASAAGGNSANAHASARGFGHSSAVTSAAGGVSAGGGIGGGMGGGHGNAGGGGGHGGK